MTDNLLTFQNFNDIALANEIAGILKQNNIDCIIEDNQRRYFDPSFANNTIDPDILLKLRADDFVKAHKVLDDYYKEKTETVDADYYLLRFSDNELIEIVSKPDEWGAFDYQLAQKLLKDRGKEIASDSVQNLKTKRIKDLAAPENASDLLIAAGYFFILFGGFIGIIIGWSLYYSKKTLPDGERVFVYTPKHRAQGKLIFWLSLIVFVASISIRLITLAQGNDTRSYQYFRL